MRKSVLIIFVLIVVTATGQNTRQPDTIFWHAGYRVLPIDFKMQQAEPEQLMALKNGQVLLAYSKIDLQVTYSFKKDSNLTFARAYFIRSKSWIGDSTIVRTIMHEQGHFDIAELYARMFDFEMRKYKKLGTVEFIEKSWEKLKEIKLSLIKEWEKYDLESIAKIGFNDYQKKLARKLDEYPVQH